MLKRGFVLFRKGGACVSLMYPWLFDCSRPCFSDLDSVISTWFGVRVLKPLITDAYCSQCIVDYQGIDTIEITSKLKSLRLASLHFHFMYLREISIVAVP